MKLEALSYGQTNKQSFLNSYNVLANAILIMSRISPADFRESIPSLDRVYGDWPERITLRGCRRLSIMRDPPY